MTLDEALHKVEIDRKYSERQGWKYSNGVYLADEIYRQRIEIERLTRALQVETICHQVASDSNRAKREEIERLRTALRLSRQWRDYYRYLWLGPQSVVQVRPPGLPDPSSPDETA